MKKTIRVKLHNGTIHTADEYLDRSDDSVITLPREFTGYVKLFACQPSGNFRHPCRVMLPNLSGESKELGKREFAGMKCGIDPESLALAIILGQTDNRGEIYGQFRFVQYAGALRVRLIVDRSKFT